MTGPQDGSGRRRGPTRRGRQPSAPRPRPQSGSRHPGRSGPQDEPDDEGLGLFGHSGDLHDDAGHPDENPTELLRLEHDDVDHDQRGGGDRARAAPAYVHESDAPRRRSRGHRRGGRRRRNRAIGWVAALALIVCLGVVAWFGVREFLGLNYDDYDGSGGADVLVRVAEGDSTGAIAGTLEQQDVVASSTAFVKAGKDENRVRSIQPGYYVLKKHMSGQDAVTQIVDPNSRVGVFEIKGGAQLDSVAQPDGSVSDGVLAQLSKASCAKLNGQDTCVGEDELRSVVETADLGELGVPQWALADAAGAEDKRRIEGLIAPGKYDVQPGSDATQLLSEVLSKSAAKLGAAGLPAAAGAMGKSPYEVLVIASLVEREGVRQDFSKISRVIYNRLDENMNLEFDSTVNYVLDRPEVRTNPEDRAQAGAYNTYQNQGLPPTPISAPSSDALAAAKQPKEGDWLFFVKCEQNGLSCFASTNGEHDQNRREAQARGVY